MVMVFVPGGGVKMPDAVAHVDGADAGMVKNPPKLAVLLASKNSAVRTEVTLER
jgi:hypothetical protein